MKLIAITTESLFRDEALALDSLFGAGLELLHLRKPSASRQELTELLLGVREEYYGRIVLHDHFGLLDSFPLKGVHLNRRNTTPPRHRPATVSRSCHSLEELAQSPGRCDYLFLSPVFDSISKPGYRRAFDHDRLLEAASAGLINEKVVALGGIDEQTISGLSRYGFGGAAVLGSLWGGYARDKDRTALLGRMTRLTGLANDISPIIQNDIHSLNNERG